MSTPSMVDKESVGAILGKVMSGWYVVTAKSDEKKVGMLASWVQQAGFEPPMISVAIHPDRELFHLVLETRRFVVNILSDQNRDLVGAFGKYSPDQFDRVTCQDAETGVILNDAVGYLECHVKQTVDVGDHTLFIAEVLRGSLQHPEHEPRAHVRRDGFKY